MIRFDGLRSYKTLPWLKSPANLGSVVTPKCVLYFYEFIKIGSVRVTYYLLLVTLAVCSPFETVPTFHHALLAFTVEVHHELVYPYP